MSYVSAFFIEHVLQEVDLVCQGAELSCSGFPALIEDRFEPFFACFYQMAPAEHLSFTMEHSFAYWGSEM